VIHKHFFVSPQNDTCSKSKQQRVWVRKGTVLPASSIRTLPDKREKGQLDKRSNLGIEFDAGNKQKGTVMYVKSLLN